MADHKHDPKSSSASHSSAPRKDPGQQQPSQHQQSQATPRRDPKTGEFEKAKSPQHK